LNPGSDDGTVPDIDPIDPSLKSKDPQTFVDLIDPLLQDGSVPDGKAPKLKMPSFGNTYALSQPEIADIEAYTLRINGVQRAVIASPVVAPIPYLWWTLGGLAIVLVGTGLALTRR
jgi:hypothetical protein